MPLNIDTFSNVSGGSAVYKALAHPLAEQPAQALLAALRTAGSVAIYDPDGLASAFDTFHSFADLELAGVFVQNIEQVGRENCGRPARPVTELGQSNARAVLIASFDSRKARSQIDRLLPASAVVVDFSGLMLPRELQTDPDRYLSPLNFATNFVFFRDENGHHTRLVTANYWSRYKADGVRLWCRLFAADGRELVSWTETTSGPESSLVIDSADVRARHNLPPFTGQLFVHAVGVKGHDIVKYALDTYGDGKHVLSATHDANSWPSDLYAGLPAPDDGEDVVLWVQNSHPLTIAPGEIGLAPMGSNQVVTLNETIAPFATRALHVSDLLPDLRWPRQIEIHAGKHVVRPRYEVTARNGRSRIAHPNVERADLKLDPNLKSFANFLGKGHILPAPILPLTRFQSSALPTPMSTAQSHLPVRALIYGADGHCVVEHRLGNLPRDHATLLDASTLADGKLGSAYGHVELVYDFDSGDVADGWLHALFRYREIASGHKAETSFGSHIFNMALTYRGEPQSYSGPPPGLSTRLFLRVAPGSLDTFCHLIYPVSGVWHATSTTSLTLRGTNGDELERKELNIPASGSRFITVRDVFGDDVLSKAGPYPYVIVRDETCRLFGYHGVISPSGSFSLDHMFGF
ncbi:MAG: hypothetical protein ABSD74_02180 [Rhizomicrobium sp.]|jgi:hypothetical protein